MLTAMAIAHDSARAQPLDSALAGLMEANPQVLAARNAWQAAGEAIEVARSGYWPTVRLGSNAGYDYVNSPARRAAFNDAYMRGRETAGLTLTQKLFDGFATDSAVDSAHANKAVSAANLEAVQQNVMLEGIVAYMDVLRQSRLLQYSREAERNIQTQMNLEDERVRKGAGMAVDVLQAKHRLQVAKERRLAIEGALETAIARYIQVFGQAPDMGSMKDPQPAADQIPPKLDEALEAARQENPSVQGATHAIAVAQEKRTAARAGYYPTIDLVGRTNYENDRDGVVGTRRDWSLLVQLNWELFSGFRTEAQVAQTSYEHASARDSQNHTTRKALEQTRIAWSTLATARERLAVMENAVNLADEVFELRRKQRQAGNATVMDVLDAESDTYTARITYVNASTDMRLAIYQLLHAMGRLTAEAVDRPGFAATPPGIK